MYLLHEEKTALTEMEEAADEEKKLAVQRRDVDQNCQSEMVCLY